MLVGPAVALSQNASDIYSMSYTLQHNPHNGTYSLYDNCGKIVIITHNRLIAERLAKAQTNRDASVEDSVEES